MNTLGEQNTEEELETERRNRYIDQLDRHLDWIKACDTKASIVLAVIGIFLTSLTADHSMKMLGEISRAIIKDINFSNVLYSVLLLAAIGGFIYGAYNLIRVLTPQLSKEASLNRDVDVEGSLYFFESIAKNQLSTFKTKMKNRTVSEDIEDIISQIYVNATIATVKYDYYRKGIKFSFLSIAAIVVLYVMGIILVKAGGM